jgi:hypothetical protein
MSSTCFFSPPPCRQSTQFAYSRGSGRRTSIEIGKSSVKLSRRSSESTNRSAHTSGCSLFVAVIKRNGCDAHKSGIYDAIRSLAKSFKRNRLERLWQQTKFRWTDCIDEDSTSTQKLRRIKKFKSLRDPFCRTSHFLKSQLQALKHQLSQQLDCHTKRSRRNSSH